MEKWDTNGDGYLDEAELQAMNASAGLGAPPASESPRPAAAIKTLADFVSACDDVDSMEELLADYSSPEEFEALLEECDSLLKDKTKLTGQKQREKLLSEHALHSGGGAAGAAAGAAAASGISEGVPPALEPSKKAAAAAAADPAQERKQAPTAQKVLEEDAAAAGTAVSA